MRLASQRPLRTSTPPGASVHECPPRVRIRACGHNSNVSRRNVFQATIYVDVRDAQEVADGLAMKLAATVEGDTIVTPILDLDVARNDEKPVGRADKEDAFLFFPCVIEAFTAEAPADERVVGAVARVLAALDELGIGYVTAADFEEDLPNQGRSDT